MTEKEQELQKKIYELEKEVKRLNLVIQKDSKIKYGLRWLDVPEGFEKDSENKIPILEEVKERAIKNDDGKPTHILIEGDNYHALKCLNYTHKGKVDVIYIDPPYNTGKEFVYKDKRFLDQFPNGQTIDANHPLRHSAWLSFMSKRLELAKELLSEKGVIFISIDDNEQANLKLLCDQIFGENNFVGDVIWKRKRGRDNSARWLSKSHEYCLLFAKNKENVNFNNLDLDEETIKAYKNPDNDSRGVYRMLGCWARGTQGGVKYEFTSKSGKYFSERLWLFSKENLKKMDDDNKLIFKGDNVYRKMFITENSGKIPETLWDDVSNAANASDEIKQMFGNIVFESPKPIPYIRRMLQISTTESSIILDFFAGSGTTLHATMELNKDGGNRQCILVQENYNNICSEITYERNRRVMQGYKDLKGENIPGLGNSLKYYKTAFVGENDAEHATDADKILLSQKAGCLLSLAEDTLEEYITTDCFQIFGDDKGKFTGVYFSGKTDMLDEFVSKLEILRDMCSSNKVNAYFFSWGSGEEFESEFKDTERILIKSIPEPILRIYRALN